MENKVYFISGMDTNRGKSYSTGYLAREWNAKESEQSLKK